MGDQGEITEDKTLIQNWKLPSLKTSVLLSLQTPAKHSYVTDFCVKHNISVQYKNHFDVSPTGRTLPHVMIGCMMRNEVSDHTFFQPIKNFQNSSFKSRIKITALPLIRFSFKFHFFLHFYVIIRIKGMKINDL